MINHVVLGLGFGDEGKGLVTDYLCSCYPKALVVRFSGGQQAGHTVYRDDLQHVFSNFGSGTLNGNKTYWSPSCTVDPFSLFQELQNLLKKGVDPLIYLDGSCPITTPIEKHLNQQLDCEDGTCGFGVWRTLLREETGASLLVEDLFFPKILDLKLQSLIATYNMKDIPPVEFEIFKLACEYIRKSPCVQLVHDIPEAPHYIYEGSQGLLLDPKFGFFPHVTASRITGNQLSLNLDETRFYYVTRAYQTRHGNGPMTNTDVPLNLQNNLKETNVYNKFQGEFRASVLDLDLLRYVLFKEKQILSECKKTLVITCLDQLTEYTLCQDRLIKFPDEKSFVNYIAKDLCFTDVLVSRGPKAINISEFNLNG